MAPGFHFNHLIWTIQIPLWPSRIWSQRADTAAGFNSKQTLPLPSSFTENMHGSRSPGLGDMYWHTLGSIIWRLIIMHRTEWKPAATPGLCVDQTSLGCLVQVDFNYFNSIIVWSHSSHKWKYFLFCLLKGTDPGLSKSGAYIVVSLEELFQSPSSHVELIMAWHGTADCTQGVRDGLLVGFFLVLFVAKNYPLTSVLPLSLYLPRSLISQLTSIHWLVVNRSEATTVC